MKSKSIKQVGLLAAVITLLLPAAGFGQVIIGDWDNMTDEGWLDHNEGSPISITNSAVTNKYSYEVSQGTPVMALRIDQAGWNQNLRLNLQDNGLIGAFMTNNQLRFEFSVPAGTNGGYSGVELIINADGYGFEQQFDFTKSGDPDNGSASGVQYYFWDGSPERTAVITFNYHHILAAMQDALGGADPGFVEIIFQTNNGGGAPDHFQINDVTLLQGLPPLLPSGHSPNLVTSDATPTMEAYFDDGTETVNSNAVTMTVDGVDVSTNAVYSYDSSNATTTISYTPTTPFDGSTTHTAKVVVASTPGGTLFTNEWSFDVLLLNDITYVDASDANILMAPSTNGPVGAGLPLVTNDTDTADGIWRSRTGFGIAPGTNSLPVGRNAVSTGGSGTILESAGYFVLDNTPRLKVSVPSVADNTYNIYVYYWSDEGGSPWGIRAGLEDTPGVDSLQQVTNGVLIATDDSALQDGRQLYQAFLGVVAGTSIDVFVEDLPATGNNRTWFDGIGYEPTTIIGPSVNPDIQSFAASGGSVSLTWNSEVGVTYTIMHKSSLTDGWTPVKSDIAGGDPTTTDSVSMSGADQEFFSIEGN